MFGIDIDNSPDAPVGTPATRRTVAIHWSWTSDYSTEQIADALGVQPRTVESYLQDGPTDAVQDKMDDVESEVRMVAIAELKSQLQAAGHRSRTAEQPVKVWTDANGRLNVKDKRNPETGEITGKYPVPSDMELDADEEARYYARAEVRDILEQLTDLTGAAEPDEVNLSLDELVS